MASLKTKFSVGLFLIIGVATVIVAVIWLGMSNYLEKGRYFAAYFDESVQGLEKDSPVKYRGVSIGRVHRIAVAPDEKLIEVILKIESQIQPQRPTLDIVAKLKSVGITGLMFVELDRRNNAQPDLNPRLDFSPKYPVIPTQPSEISQIFKGIDDIIARFRSLDMNQISTQLIGALKNINHAVDSLEVDKLSADLHTVFQRADRLIASPRWEQLMGGLNDAADQFGVLAKNGNRGVADIRHTVGRLDQLIKDNEHSIAKVAADLSQATDRIKQLVGNTADLMEDTSRHIDVLQRQASGTLANLEQASQALNRLLEKVSSQPSQLIFAPPPAPRFKTTP